jgi:hypothetical protein
VKEKKIEKSRDGRGDKYAGMRGASHWYIIVEVLRRLEETGRQGGGDKEGMPKSSIQR